MPLKKLSIAAKEAEKVRELALNKMSGRRISIELGINQMKIWRCMEFMGLNKKKNIHIPKEESNTFNWKDFNNTVI